MYAPVMSRRVLGPPVIRTGSPGLGTLFAFTRQSGPMYNSSSVQVSSSGTVSHTSNAYL